MFGFFFMWTGILLFGLIFLILVILSNRESRVEGGKKDESKG